MTDDPHDDTTPDWARPGRQEHDDWQSAGDRGDEMSIMHWCIVAMTFIIAAFILGGIVSLL